MKSKKEAVFFISFGGPEKREEIRPFLEIVTRGRRIPPERIDEVAHHYETIGGASPINAITRRQAEDLEKALARTDTPWPVYIGNRNWHPFLEDTLRKMAADGIQRTVGFITAAHRTEASWERYINAVEEARQRIGAGAPSIEYVDPWFEHPLFIEAIAARVQDVVQRLSPSDQNRLAWVFTAHSIPTPMAEASSYVRELRRTAELVARKFSQKTWALGYTSRSGKPTDPWLEPDVCDWIREEAKKGVRDILAIPIGFIADHVEVLYDLDVEAQDAARAAGVRLLRAQTVGDHSMFIQMISDVVRERALKVPA